MNGQQTKKSTAIWWISSLVSILITVAFLKYKPEFFWVMLPFVCTSVVKAFDAI